MARTPRIAFAAALLLVGGASVGGAQGPADVGPPRSIVVTMPVFEAGGADRVGFAVAPLPPASTPGGVRLRIRLEGADGATFTLWEGDASVPASWDGFVGGNLVPAGRYDLVGEVSAGGRVQRIRRPVRLEVTRADVVPGPRLPETTTAVVRDVGQEERWQRRGFVTIGFGVVTALAASSLVGPAVQNSPPESGMRYAVAGAYVGGLAIAGWGAWRMWRNARTEAVRTIAVPLEANIRANRSALSAGASRATVRWTFEDDGDD